MSDNRWQRIEDIFHRAIELAPEARSAFLNEVCAADESLRKEVESLLTHDAEDGSTFVGGAGNASMSPECIAHYRISTKLGEGGMGAVYRATDTKLGREVAIKVLPDTLASDPERMARFTREAKVLASLNHPNIAAIYGVEDRALIMELVEGSDLRGPLPVATALNYALQIAGALDAAHEKGIVHRDLKPANIRITPDGVVKVLDFGLAKIAEPTNSAADSTRASATKTGVIMGTAAYMAPEQARGQTVDKRADIWAFGVVFYELLTGAKLFGDGKNVSDTLAAVLTSEPDFNVLPKDTPLRVRRLLEHCLRKDPKQRLRDIGDARILLDEPEPEAPGPLKPPRRMGPLVYGAALLVIIAAVAGLWYFRSVPPVREGERPAVPLTAESGNELSASFSPDGNEVVYAWNGEKRDNFDIYRKRIGGGKPLRLTFDPALDFAPAWAPDGENVAFLRDLGRGRFSVLLVPALGGPERKLAEIQVSGWMFWELFARHRLSWSPDSTWLVTSNQPSPSEPPALFLISVESGEKRQLTSPSALSVSAGDTSPAFSPDGRNLVFTRGLSLCLLSLSKALSPQGEPRRVTPPEWRLAASYPVWTPESGNILFVGGFGGEEGLWKIAASGSAMPVKISAGEFGNQPALSRDGRRLVYTRGSWGEDIWHLELSRPGSPAGPPATLIASRSVDSCPRYSPDGRKIAFASYRSGFPEIWICDANGSNLIQLTHFKGNPVGTPRWSPDGNQIAFDGLVVGGDQWDVFAISAGGGKPRRVTDNPAQDDAPSWSRDGMWIYFASNRTGESQVWKTPAGGGEPIQVTKKGGYAAFESNDGKFLYYAKGPFSAGPPRMSLWKLALGSGEETPVVEDPPLMTYDFALVDEGVYFGSEVAEGSALQFLNFSDGKIKRVITSADSAFRRLGASPDGRRLLYSRRNLRDSDLILVENFH